MIVCVPVCMRCMFSTHMCWQCTNVHYNVCILMVPELLFSPPTDEVIELSKSGNVSASIGDRLNLTCRGYSCETDSFVFEWYLNGGELNSSVPGVNIGIVGEDELSHLSLDIASESSFGNYTCEVVNFGTSISVIVYELGEQYTYM